MDARVKGILQGRPLSEKLMLGLLVTIAGPDAVKKALDEISGTTVDFSQRIEEAGNRPLIDFLGMNRKQVHQRLAGDATLAGDEEKLNAASDAIFAAFRERGMEVDEDAPRQTRAEANEQQAEANARAQVIGRQALNAGRTGGATPANPAAWAPADMATVGTEKIPVNELGEWTEDDLRQIDGFTDADMLSVRQYRANAGSAQNIVAPPASIPGEPAGGGASDDANKPK